MKQESIDQISIDYYNDQISRIDVNSEFGPNIKIRTCDTQTNSLLLNKLSAQVLIKWLEKNFIK